MTQGDAVEETVKMVLDLPPGQDWKWLPDCNIIVFSSRLDEAGQEAALTDLQATWRRELIKAVPSAPAEGAVAGLCANLDRARAHWRSMSARTWGEVT